MPEQPFPDEHVQASIAARRLQAQHQFSDLPPEMRRAMNAEREHAVVAGASERTEWVYFVSPDETWRMLSGRAGWLLYDPESRTQHSYKGELMN